MSQKGKQLVTVSDVSDKLGLSRATVSYVLNGKAKEMKISDRTIRRVKEMADELGYVPNYFAKVLREKRSKTIGILFASLDLGWAHHVFQGMLDVFDQDSYIPQMSVHLWDSDRQEREIESFLERQVDGLICQPIVGCGELYSRISKRVPFVQLSDNVLDNDSGSFVAWDSRRAAAIAMEHLIQIGRRRIGFIGAAHGGMTTPARYEAYEQTLNRSNLPVTPQWIAWEQPGQSPEGKVRKMFSSSENCPDALYCLNDWLALKVIDVLRSMGIRVPEDVAVIGMSDFYPSSYAGLSTMKEPCHELGRVAASTILRAISHPQELPLHRLITYEKLIVRSTTMNQSDS
ncbi:MAG: LacI family DNA-binding transcriptional regulator [Phycisphaeraceae bacterium JB051]